MIFILLLPTAFFMLQLVVCATYPLLGSIIVKKDNHEYNYPSIYLSNALLSEWISTDEISIKDINLKEASSNDIQELPVVYFIHVDKNTLFDIFNYFDRMGKAGTLLNYLDPEKVNALRDYHPWLFGVDLYTNENFMEMKDQVLENFEVIDIIRRRIGLDLLKRLLKIGDTLPEEEFIRDMHKIIYKNNDVMLGLENFCSWFSENYCGTFFIQLATIKILDNLAQKIPNSNSGSVFQSRQILNHHPELNHRRPGLGSHIFRKNLQKARTEKRSAKIASSRSQCDEFINNYMSSDEENDMVMTNAHKSESASLMSLDERRMMLAFRELSTGTGRSLRNARGRTPADTRRSFARNHERYFSN